MRTIRMFIVLLLLPSMANALNVETHKAINERVGKIQTPNGFSLNQYLIDNLGISGGVEEPILNSSTNVNQKISFWLRDGGEYEDWPAWYLPYVRSKNHFHNPINDQGFSGIWDTGFLSGDSAIIWALKDKGTQSPGGYYSWLDVRDYYYKALTSSTKTERDTNFAQTFRGVGQLMHLIQDMSVPEHARNDGHYLPYVGYENWISKNPVEFVNATAFPVFFTGSISSIKSFMDTDTYTGLNPGVTTSYTIGLSEYSNANFLTDDTKFTGFTYPNKSSTNLQSYIDGNELPEIVIGEDNIPDTTFYIKKDKDGEIIKRFVKPGYFTNYILTTDPTSPVLSLSFLLDENVYADYASLLLPRAVGYSAGLLNYFFRGNMDFTIDANDREDGVKGVKISNRFTEDMDGTFNLYYDTADTNRHLLGSWNISLTSQGTSQILSFSLPQDYYKYKYTLAFRGKMGTEQDAVAGYQYAGWREEWNNGLHGNHTWLHTDIDLILQNSPYYGHTINEIADGKLIKENISYPGNDLPRVNQTIILDAYKKVASNTNPYCVIRYSDFCFPYDFGEEFPMSINKNTWISIKIDEISINEEIPYQYCDSNDYGPGSWQGVDIQFDNGFSLFFTIPGHVSPGDATTGRWIAYIEQGKEWSYNIFATFKNAGVEFVEPVNITGIDIVQQLWYLCNPSTIEYRQKMVVDYIRIEERPTILQSQSIIVSP
ncbi:MAG: hypothetical protein AABY39_02595 [Nitrospirota bacterium]